MKKKLSIAFAIVVVALAGAGAAYAAGQRSTVTVSACVGPLGLTRLSTTCLPGVEHSTSWVGNGYSKAYVVEADGVAQVFVHCHDGDDVTGGGGFARDAAGQYTPLAISAPAGDGTLAGDHADSWLIRSVGPSDTIMAWVDCLH